MDRRESGLANTYHARSHFGMVRMGGEASGADRTRAAGQSGALGSWEDRGVEPQNQDE